MTDKEEFMETLHALNSTISKSDKDIYEQAVWDLVENRRKDWIAGFIQGCDEIHLPTFCHSVGEELEFTRMWKRLKPVLLAHNASPLLQEKEEQK